MLKRFMKSNKGFTLVELMVVVVILAVLVAIAVPIYNNITDSAELRACHANLRTIDGAKTQAMASPDLNWPEDFFTSGDLPKCPADGEYSNTNPGDPQAYCSLHTTYSGGTATPAPSTSP